MSHRHDTASRRAADVDAIVPIIGEPVSQPITVVENLPPIPPEPRVRRYVIGAAIACLATLWLAATGWLLATW